MTGRQTQKGNQVVVWAILLLFLATFPIAAIVAGLVSMLLAKQTIAKRLAQLLVLTGLVLAPLCWWGLWYLLQPRGGWNG